MPKATAVREREVNVVGSTPLVSAALKSSRQINSLTNKLVQKRATRYVFSCYNDMLCTGVPGGKIPRGLIHPLVPQVRRDQAMAIPVEVSLERVNHTATYMVDDVQRISAGVTGMYRTRGGVELPPLFNVDVETFEEMGVNKLIFGARLLHTAKEFRDRFDLVEKATADLPLEVSERIQALLVLLRHSVTTAMRHAQRVVNIHEGEMAKALAGGEGSERYLGHYDARALKAIEFAGLTRRDEAIAEVAANQNKIQNMLPELIAQRQAAPGGLDVEALKVFGAAMGEAMADRMFALQNSKTAKPKAGKTAKE